MLIEEKIIHSNWIIRIIAFLVACSLWLYVMNDQNPIVEQTFEIPVQRLNQADNMSVNNIPKTVNIIISAPRNAVFNADEDLVSAYVDLKDLKEGKQKIGVFVKTKIGNVVKVEPYNFTVDVDKIVEKRFSATAKMLGVPTNGVVVGKMDLEPEIFTIKGRSKDVEKVKQIVVSVDVNSQYKNFEYETRPIPIANDGTEIYNLEVFPSKVRADVVMMKQLVTKTFIIKPNIKGPFAPGYTVSDVEIIPKVVKISAIPDIIEKINDIKTNTIDLAGIKSDVQVEVPLIIPARALADTKTVKVRIKLKNLNK